MTRRRAEETDEERTARLADNTGREARRRAEETGTARTYGHVRAKERPVWLLFLARGLKFFGFVLFACTATHVRARTYGHALVSQMLNRIL